MASIYKFLSALAFTFLLMGCNTKQSKVRTIDFYIAKDAKIVLKTSNLKALQQEIDNNTIMPTFGTTQIYTRLKKDNSFVDYLNPEGFSVLSLSKRNDSVNDIAIATRQTNSVFLLDSLKNKQVETLSYGDIEIQRITLDNTLFFTATKDSVFVAATSQKQLEDILNKEQTPSLTLQKALTVLKNAELTSVVRQPRYAFSKENEHTLSEYQSLDLVLTPNGAIASGVALVKDSVPGLLSVFKGQIPQQNDIAQIIPRNATRAVSITMSDPSLLLKNLSEYRNEVISDAPVDLLSSANEVGEIILPNGNAVILKSIDPTVTKDALASSITETGSFRETTLYNYDDGKLLKNSLAPFIQSDSTAIAFQLEQFFVFAENTTIAETIIAAFKNNNCLHKDPSFINSSSYISTSSSFITFGMNEGSTQVIQQLEHPQSSKANTISNGKKSSLALLQYSFDRDFAHIHFASLEASETATRTNEMVSEVFNKKFEKQLLAAPSFFNNHRTGKKNIVVQDVENTLYLLSNTGKTLWTKRLESPIIGSVQEIDILRNGRKQMTFTTQNKWYVLDRNGKDVRGFPVSFKDDITQPLSVFDYDNNRKYRFAIVQGREILLYDSNAKIVKGFKYRKADSKIVLPASHIRMGNKDYILIAEENGSLNILSRTGKIRVPVKEKFNFSKNTIQREGSNFVVITKENEKKSIAANGKISSVALDVSSNYHFATKGNTKITLDDNLLRINGVLTELPFGIYTAPQIFTANRNTYITVTETQEKKVYVIKKDGTILNGFPVFGSSKALLTGTKKSVLLSVIGQDNEVVLIQF